MSYHWYTEFGSTLHLCSTFLNDDYKYRVSCFFKLVVLARSGNFLPNINVTNIVLVTKVDRPKNMKD
jgi:hypothetical protein